MSTERTSLDEISRVAYEQTSALPECPVCAYSLHGLPRKHRCPECGFAYDHSTCVWQERGRGRFAGLSVILFGLLAVGYVLALHEFDAGSAKMVLAALMIAIVGLGAVRNVITFVHRAYVAVVPDGVRLSVRKSQDLLIKWGDLRRIDVREIGNRAFVKICVVARPHPIDVSGVLHDPYAANAFREAIVQRFSEIHEKQPRPVSGMATPYT